MGRGTKKAKGLLTGAPSLRGEALHLRMGPSDLGASSSSHPDISSVVSNDHLFTHASAVVQAIENLQGILDTYENPDIPEESMAEYRNTIEKMIEQFKKLEAGEISQEDAWQAEDLKRAVFYNLLEYFLYFDDNKKLQKELLALQKAMLANGEDPESVRLLDFKAIRSDMKEIYGSRVQRMHPMNLMALYRWHQIQEEMGKKDSRTRDAFADFVADSMQADREGFQIESVVDASFSRNGPSVSLGTLALLAEGVCVGERHPDFQLIEDIYYAEREVFMEQAAFGGEASRSPFLFVPDSRWSLSRGMHMEGGEENLAVASNIDFANSGLFVSTMSIDTLHNIGITQGLHAGSQAHKEYLATVFVHEMIHDTQYRHFKIIRETEANLGPEKAIEVTNRLEGLTQALTWAVRGRSSSAAIDAGVDEARAIFAILREANLPESDHIEVLQRLNQVPFYDAFREMDKLLALGGSTKTAEEIWIDRTRNTPLAGRALSTQDVKTIQGFE